MIKRVARYSLLILTLLIAGVWADSYWHVRFIRYVTVDSKQQRLGMDKRFEISGTIDYTNLYITWTRGFGGGDAPPGFRYGAGPADPSYRLPNGGVGFRFLGLMSYAWHGEASIMRCVAIPFWMLFAPFFLLTIALWRRPFQQWRQKRSSKGFEVQPVADVKA